MVVGLGGCGRDWMGGGSEEVLMLGMREGGFEGNV